MKQTTSVSIEQELEPRAISTFPALQLARRPLILIAEDCENLRRALVRGLRRSNYLVHGASDGVEALAALRTIEPDVLLLDLGLPRMHGFKLLHHLRETHTTDVPILVLTGDTNPASWEHALRSGARRVLLKPTSTHEVQQAIEELLADE